MDPGFLAAAIASVAIGSPPESAPEGQSARICSYGLLLSYAVVPNLDAARDLITELSPASRLAERQPIEMMQRAAWPPRANYGTADSHTHR
jgi:hypothetical protein